MTAPSLSSFRRMVPTWARASSVPARPRRPDGFQQHVGGGAQEHAELIGPPRAGAGAIGKEAELLFLDPILPAPSGAALRAACGRLSRSARFHLAARAVECVVKVLRVACEVGHHRGGGGE
jgi:hypothetical protein